MDLRTQLMQILKASGFETTELSDDAHLQQDLEIDSTELIEIAYLLEKSLSIPIDDKELRPLKTFGELVSFVSARLTPAASTA